VNSLRVLIVDDHEASRRGLRSLLSSRPDWVICGEAVDGTDAVEKAKALRPDLVLMDISMPRLNGLEATRIIRRELPESEVVIVSQNDPAVVHQQAAEVNAAGYVGKSDLSQDLISTIERIFQKRNSGGGEVSKENWAILDGNQDRRPAQLAAEVSLRL
jgi:DNA-binding NarL/FixJ family response regulator